MFCCKQPLVLDQGEAGHSGKELGQGSSPGFSSETSFLQETDCKQVTPDMAPPSLPGCPLRLGRLGESWGSWWGRGCTLGDTTEVKSEVPVSGLPPSPAMAQGPQTSLPSPEQSALNAHHVVRELILVLRSWGPGPGHTRKQKRLFAQVRSPKRSQPLDVNTCSDCCQRAGQHCPFWPAPLRCCGPRILRFKFSVL